jgi:tRNA(Ile)-lysidine synthase
MDRHPVSHGRNAVLSRWIRRIEKSMTSRKLVRDGQKILVAVSGGLDSMVLLKVLHHLAGAHQWKLTVAHFNHQLRGAAGDEDERLVCRTARGLGLEAVAGRGDVGAAARKEGISLEMAGRKMRHGFLARTARRLRIPTIVLAHHADDQVELFFLRLLRGTGGRGLGGMQWSNASPSDPALTLVRPLLDQSKEALREAARAGGVRFSEDASNAEIHMDRNRIRHELLPLLRKHYQPRLEERVLSLMELAGAEAQVVAELAERWLTARRRVRFDRLAPAVQRSALYLQLARMGHAPDFELVERLRATENQPVAVGPEQWVTRDEGGMVRARKMGALEFDRDRTEMVLTGRQGRAVWDGLALSWEILQVAGAGCEREPKVEHFDADRIGGRVWLRHWQPGDRFRPIGMKSARKLQDLFTDLKVPRAERHRRVVAATGEGEVFWVEGLRMAEGFKLEPGTRRRLRWEWKRRKL